MGKKKDTSKYNQYSEKTYWMTNVKARFLKKECQSLNRIEPEFSLPLGFTEGGKPRRVLTYQVHVTFEAELEDSWASPMGRYC